MPPNPLGHAGDDRIPLVEDAAPSDSYIPQTN